VLLALAVGILTNGLGGVAMTRRGSRAADGSTAAYTKTQAIAHQERSKNSTL
jgi:hypothetical protein